jgi:release factor glutamine methyltransferase
MVDRRTAGQPLEHVLGWVLFCGRRLRVCPDVFVPRRRTELLARHAAAAFLTQPAAHVVDLCCGTGAVGAALSYAVLPQPIDVHAVDIDAAAVRCARHNLTPVGGQVHEGDLYAPLPRNLRGRVGVIVANAPYVPTATIDLLPPEARDFEPRVALDGGADGLTVQRRVAAQARQWLAPGGSLLMETSAAQASRSARLLRAEGLTTRVARCAELDSTIVIGTRPDPR